MKPLVLTEWLIPDFMENNLADLVLNFVFFDFVWGPQPSADQLADHLGPRTDHDERELGGSHWSDWGPTGAKTESIVIEAWLNFASNTKPSNYGSTCGRVRN